MLFTKQILFTQKIVVPESSFTKDDNEVLLLNKNAAKAFLRLLGDKRSRMINAIHFLDEHDSLNKLKEIRGVDECIKLLSPYL